MGVTVRQRANRLVVTPVHVDDSATRVLATGRRHHVVLVGEGVYVHLSWVHYVARGSLAILTHWQLVLKIPFRGG